MLATLAALLAMSCPRELGWLPDREATRLPVSDDRVESQRMNVRNTYAESCESTTTSPFVTHSWANEFKVLNSQAMRQNATTEQDISSMCCCRPALHICNGTMLDQLDSAVAITIVKFEYSCDGSADRKRCWYRLTHAQLRRSWRNVIAKTSATLLYMRNAIIDAVMTSARIHDEQCDHTLKWAAVLFLILLYKFIDHARQLRINKWMRYHISLVILLQAALPVVGGRDDEGTSSGPKCPIFEGITASFTAWLISFTAWIAWKAPELVPVLQGAKTRPKLAPPGADKKVAEAKLKARNKWDLLNTQLYGAVVSHVAQPIQSSLHVQASGDGSAAMKHLKSRYGAQSTGDRAEATARLQKSYFDPRAKLAESDVIRQYNEMSLAAADIVAAGGAKPDDDLLISMFENSLPVPYAFIRQMVRYSKHVTFDAYYNDFLTQVKAEERANSLQVNPSAFSATDDKFVDPNTLSMKGKNDPYKLRGEALRDLPVVKNPCFNCGRGNHPRFKCRQGKVTCRFCGAAHIPELCPRGPGGALRDSLAPGTRQALERQVSAAQGSSSATDGQPSKAYSAKHDRDEAQWLQSQYKAYMSRKRPYDQSSDEPPSKEARASSASSRSSVASGSSSAASSHPPSVMTAAEGDPAYEEITDFFNNLKPRAFLVDCECAYKATAHTNNLHHLIYIDSQASNFVVPSAEYLSEITDSDPHRTIDTANGPVKPKCIGNATIEMFNDDGKWYRFDVTDVWVLPECGRILYSQPSMNRLGIVHRLDEGYLMMPDRTRKSIDRSSYTTEVSFVKAHAYAARSIAIPMPRHLARTNHGADTRSSIPQQLMWQRLGFPSKNIWLHTPDVTSDHGLPGATHLIHDFPVLDAVARARAKALPFHEMREEDELPAPGSLIYMDFAGPLTASYPHKFTSYVGAIDAGSGYARVLPCHSPNADVARQCLELLLTDLRALMGLTHKLKPQVVVSDQGTQFMSYHFKDFLSSEQIRHWPSTTYTPQQNAVVERMWGTRFGMARSLLKFASLGPAMHPYALQCANWIINRLPQSTRGNLSPYFILSRRSASLGYLKSFGCLTRLTVPRPRWEGDKHFADRGLLGIYLGPSEQSPGAVVYAPSVRKFYVTREVIAYEDVHPGLKQIDSTWLQLTTDDSTHPPARLTSTQCDTLPQMPTLQLESQPVDQPMPAEAIDDGSSRQHFESGPTTLARTAVDTQTLAPASPEAVPLSATAPSDPLTVPTVDVGPSSVHYKRVLPQRSTRYSGPYRAHFVDPTAATAEEAVCNLLQSEEHGPTHPSCMLAYESSVGGLRRALVVTTTTELGDIQIPRSYNQSLQMREASYWREAIAKEYNGLLSIGTFLFMPRTDLPPGANVMRCHVVFTVKRNDDGTIDKFKARLVADGNTQKFGVDFEHVFSTVAKLSTLRLLLIIAAADDLNLSSIDIRQAYLQAVLKEDLYMEVPPGLADTDSQGRPLVVKLLRSLYGLKQAGREWHTLLSDTLKEYGFQQSSIDICLFTFSRGKSRLTIVVWVDDCVIADNDPSLRADFVTWLSGRFPVEDKGDLRWILHVKVVRDRSLRTITMSQELYVKDLLRKYDYLLTDLTRRFDSPFDASTKLTPEQCPTEGSTEQIHMIRHRQDYMALVGAFLWLANVSKPELAYVAGQLARFVSNPGMVHYRAAIRVLIYLRGQTEHLLTYRPRQHQPLRAFVDSDWSTCFSVSGGVFDYMNCAFHWVSRLQRSVSMSSTEAEYFATCVITREIVYFRDLLLDFGRIQQGATVVSTDNRGVVALSIDPVAFKKTKHILRAAEYVRDMAIRHFIRLQWIAGRDNVADLCTKPVSLATFRCLMVLLRDLSRVP